MSLVTAFIDDQGEFQMFEEHSGTYTPAELKTMKAFQEHFLHRTVDYSIIADMYVNLEKYYPDFGWDFTVTNIELLTETRNKFMWFAKGKNKNLDYIDICFTTQNRIIVRIEMKKQKACK